MEKEEDLNAENEKKEENHIKEVTDPIFGTVPQETGSNRLSVGQPLKIPPKQSTWQPHSYRRYFRFSKINFNPEKPKPTPYRPPITDEEIRRISITNGIFTYLPFSWDYKHWLSNHNSEHHYAPFMQCHIVIKKKMAVVYNKVNEKSWWVISRAKYSQIDGRIDQLNNELEKHCIRALKLFISIHGGQCDFVPITHKKDGSPMVMGEDKIKGDDFIDSIPKEWQIQDTVFKKVYLENNLELYDRGDGKASLKNYVKYATLKDHVPEIAASINEVGNEVMGGMEIIKNTIANDLKPVLMALKEQIELHLEVEARTGETLAENLKVQEATLKTQEATQRTLADLSASLKPKPPKSSKKPLKPPKKPHYGLTPREQDKIRKMTF